MPSREQTPWLGKRRMPSLRHTLSMIGRTGPATDRAARRLAAAHDIGDLRKLARQRAPRPVFDYIDGGAGDETSLRRNFASFNNVRLVPRVLRDVSTIDTSTTILDKPANLPVIIAPMGLARMAHPAGEVALARAAAAAGIPYTLSTMASFTLEDIATHAPAADRWFQLYLWRDRTASAALIDRAWQAGFTTLALTVDCAVAGARHRDLRNGMTLPPSLPLRSTLQIAMRPRWWFDALTREPLDFAMIHTPQESLAQQSARLLDPSISVADLDWLRQRWPGNLVVKGVMHPDDVVEVVNRGADAVVISNHGGRQLELAAAPLDVLGEARAAVGETFPLFLDGGVRSGAHIAAAIAAGATAVLVGRAAMFGLMAGGEMGVRRSIDLLRTGLERTMALLGAATISDLDASRIRLPGTR